MATTTAKPPMKTWGHQPPTGKQKKLADHINDQIKKVVAITREEWMKFDRLLWLYQDRFAWYGAAYTGTRRVLTRAIPTAAMGWKEGEAVLYVNPDFIFGLPFIGQCFILHHEIEHLVRSHCQVMADWPEKQAILNFVMDSLINSALVTSGEFREEDVPKDLITYDVFKQACQNQPADPKLKGKAFPSTTSLHDFVHNFTAEELLQYLPKGNDEDNVGSISTIRELMKGMHGEFGELFDDSSVDEDMKETIMENMISEAEKSCGTAPSHMQRYIDAIKDKTNRNWRMLVRGAGNSSRIRQDRSWFKFNKRKPGMAPGKFIYTEPKGMVMIDTSGSIGTEEMQAFVRELNNLSEQIQIDMGFIDAKWDPDNIPGQFVKDVKGGKAWLHAPVGGGGTAFSGFYEFMKKRMGKYDFCLILTDGFTCDSPLVPYLLARNCFALMTPNHSQQWADEARAVGFKVAVIDDAVRREQERKRNQVKP